MLTFRQDIGNHGAVGRSGNIGKQPDECRQGNEYTKILYQTEGKCAECAEDQTEKDQVTPPIFIGKRASNRVAYYAKN